MNQWTTWMCGASLALLSLAACVPASEDGADTVAGDEAEESFLNGATSGKEDGPEALYGRWGVLLVSNRLSFDELDTVVGLDRRAAESIVAHRAGLDQKIGTADDVMIVDLKTLDGLYYVGPKAFEQLLDYAGAQGWVSAKGMRALLDDVLEHRGGAEGRTHFVMPDEGDLAAIPQDPQNPLTVSKVALGRLLFHDRALAVNPMIAANAGTYSCASCHHAAGGFASGNIQGMGEGGVGFGAHGEARRAAPGLTPEQIDAQPVKTPPALNLNWQSVTLANGMLGGVGLNAGTDAKWRDGHPTRFNALGFEGVETQAIAGLGVHRLIDDAHPENTEESELVRNPIYREMFDAAFPAGERFTGINQVTTGLAIAAYERTIMAQRAPFQKYLKGQSDAMTDVEVKGALLFFGEADCVACHSGPALNSNDFYAVGFSDLDQLKEHRALQPGELVDKSAADANMGRGGFTGQDHELFAFKVPQLYNLRDHVAFGHGNSFESVREVVDYFNAGRADNPRTVDGALALTTMDMTPSDCAAIAAFIEDALHDSELHRFQPDAVPSDLCGINGDSESLLDLECP